MTTKITELNRNFMELIHKLDETIYNFGNKIF